MKILFSWAKSLFRWKNPDFAIPEILLGRLKLSISNNILSGMWRIQFYILLQICPNQEEKVAGA